MDEFHAQYAWSALILDAAPESVQSDTDSLNLEHLFLLCDKYLVNCIIGGFVSTVLVSLIIQMRRTYSYRSC